jgi:hypothetical protein
MGLQANAGYLLAKNYTLLYPAHSTYAAVTVIGVLNVGNVGTHFHPCNREHYHAGK